MNLSDVARTLAENMLAPIPMCFALGVISKRIHGGIKIPKDLYTTISIFLLMSIGFMGGHELAHEYEAHGVSKIWAPALATLLLGCLTPFTSYIVLRRFGRFSIADAAGISAHYASTSAVTYAVADSFVRSQKAPGSDAFLSPDGYLPTLVTLLECPGIAISLALGAMLLAKQRAEKASQAAAEGRGPAVEHEEGGLYAALYEVVTGQSILLMGGLMTVGFVATMVFHAHPEKLTPFLEFFGPSMKLHGVETACKGMLFRGALCVFLLEMGLVAGERLNELPKVGPFLVGFGVLMPIFHGSLGAWFGHMAGLNVAGCTVFAAIVSSASYIAAPPAVRLTLPEANPTYSITAALAITFPFNIAIGVPIYFEIAKRLAAA